MPGFELIGKKKRSSNEVFDEGEFYLLMVLILRKKFHVREFEAACEAYFKSKYCIAFHLVLWN